MKEGKATSIIGRLGKQSCETSRLPHFPEILLTDWGEVFPAVRLCLQKYFSYYL
jgi:hypothetical protein